MPIYESIVGKDYPKRKKSRKYKFWYRPTIPWKRICEDRLSRKDALHLFKNIDQDWKEVVANTPKVDDFIRIRGAIIIVFTIVALAAAITTEYYEKCSKLRFITLIIIFGSMFLA